MSSTDFSLGFDDNARPSSNVLKLPSGGSSDIFGPETPATPRSMLNHHMASNIFGSTQDAVGKKSGDNARRGVNNGDSHSRLFGETNRTFTPAKKHMKSSIPLGGPNENKVTNGNGTTLSAPTPVNGHSNCGKIKNNNSVGIHRKSVSVLTRNPVTGMGIEMPLYKSGKRRAIRHDGNPVTGEGYTKSTGGSAGAENNIINKNHVPPSGYSSGLW